MSYNIQLSVLMPAYNEVDRLRNNLLETISTLNSGARAVDSLPFEVILINDGSADGTAEVAQQVANEDSRLCVVSYHKNLGKGGALQKGFLQAQGRLVAFLDADLDLHPSLLFELLDVMHSQSADVVIGSKSHPQSHVEYPFLRQVYSWGYYLMVSLLFGLPVKDTQTGIKLFKREVLAKEFPRLHVKGYAFDLELLALANADGYRIVSAPVSVVPQRLSQRIRIKDVLTMLRDTFATWWRLRMAIRL
jgi:dolichol-phosphate mannosyltransferase